MPLTTDERNALHAHSRIVDEYEATRDEELKRLAAPKLER